MPLAASLRRRLPQGEFGRAVLTLVGGTGAAMAVVIVSSPILTRLYLPSDYGVLLGCRVAPRDPDHHHLPPLRLRDPAAQGGRRRGERARTRSLLGEAWPRCGPRGCRPLVPRRFGAASLIAYVPLLTAGQLGGGIVSTFTNWAVRTKTFSEIAANRLTQSLTQVVMQLVLGVIGIGDGRVARGRCDRARRRSRRWRERPGGRMVDHFDGSRATGSVARPRGTGDSRSVSAPSALLNTLAMQLPLLLLVAFYGTDAGGHYALADRLCSVPLTLVAAAVGQVYVADAARLAHERPRALRAGFIRTTASLARLAPPPPSSSRWSRPSSGRRRCLVPTGVRPGSSSRSSPRCTT